MSETTMTKEQEAEALQNISQGFRQIDKLISENWSSLPDHVKDEIKATGLHDIDMLSMSNQFQAIAKEVGSGQLG